MRGVRNTTLRFEIRQILPKIQDLNRDFKRFKDLKYFNTEFLSFWCPQGHPSKVLAMTNDNHANTYGLARSGRGSS